MTMLAGIGGIGATELVVILVIVLILFGPGRLPQVFESFGKSIRAFKDAQKDDTVDVATRRELPETARPVGDRPEVAELRDPSEARRGP